MELNCRVCLQTQNVMVDIFEEVEQFHTDLASLLENCGGVTVEQYDIFPKYLCQQCTEELFSCAEFRRKCKLGAKRFLEIQHKAQAEKTLVAPKHVSKKVPSAEPPVVYEPVIVDDENIDMSLADYAMDSGTKLDAVEINIVFENDPNNSAAHKTSNNETNSLGNVIQLVLPKEDSNEVDVVTTDNEEYVKACDSAEFAESIIEELENEETEVDSEQMEVAYPTTSIQSTENYNYVCEACGASFVKIVNLRRHMEIGHNAIMEFLCEKCERNFETEKDFQRHVDLCSSEVKQIKSTSVPNARTESKKKTSKGSGKHICDHCGKCLQSQFSLSMHLRTHTGERPFSCDKCQSQFKTQAALSAHEKRHIGNADLICEVCEKRFIDPTNLIVHRRTHTGSRPHACNVCNKTFSRVYLLQLHMRTHTGERPFQCEICQKSFSQSSDLKYHLATHSGDRKYSCPMCPKAFIRRNKLQVHMEKHSTPPTQQATETDTTLLAEENAVFLTNYENETELDCITINDGELC